MVLVLSDLRTLDWPERAKRAGLTTIATHIFPHEVAAFMQKDEGQQFWESCQRLGIQVEHELHAMSDLLPRSLFDKDPGMFPLNDQGQRVRDYNLCVHSAAALEVVAENAIKYTKILRATTHRYFYWIDDGKPMCRCPRCRELTDSDQALLLEHHVLQAIRQVDPQATLGHLAYARTLQPPQTDQTVAGDFPGVRADRTQVRRPLSATRCRRVRRSDARPPAGCPGRQPRLVRPRGSPDAGILAGPVAVFPLEAGEREAVAVARRRVPR